MTYKEAEPSIQFLDMCDTAAKDASISMDDMEAFESFVDLMADISPDESQTDLSLRMGVTLRSDDPDFTGHTAQIKLDDVVAFGDIASEGGGRHSAQIAAVTTLALLSSARDGSGTHADAMGSAAFSKLSELMGSNKSHVANYASSLALQIVEHGHDTTETTPLVESAYELIRDQPTEQSTGLLDVFEIEKVSTLMDIGPLLPTISKLPWIDFEQLPGKITAEYVYGHDGKPCALVVDLSECHPALRKIKLDVERNGQLKQANRMVHSGIRKLAHGERCNKIPANTSYIPMFYEKNIGSNETLLRTYFAYMEAQHDELPVYALLSLLRTKGNQFKAMKLLTRNNVHASML